MAAVLSGRLSPVSAIGPIGASPVPAPLPAPDPAPGVAPASPGVVRGTPPARPVIGVPAATPTGPRPIDPLVYSPIFEEARTADWRDCGIDPVRYTEDRLDRAQFLTPLLADPAAKVVLHRQSLRIGQVASIDGSRARNVTLPRAKDYPGRVYRSPEDGAFHIVGIAGEDWFRQTLHMLATAGVPASKILVEETFDPAAIAARDLDATLAAHDFESVTIGTMGELSRAVERVLRERERPAHVERTLAETADFLETQVRNARPDRRARWEEVRARFAAVRAAGGTALEQLERVKADPVLRGPLGEKVRIAEEGPPARELPWRVETRNADVFAHRILEVDGKKHLLVHIGGAHGDMAYHAVRHVLAAEPGLGRVNMYGSAGSFSDTLPPDTFIVPRGEIRSAEEDRALVPARNAARLEGAVETAHSSVSTLLREHRGGLARLASLPAETVDIESWHVARAVAEAGRPVELRAILRVSDVATSPALGAHRDDRQATSDYDARRKGEERAVIALGLVEGGR